MLVGSITPIHCCVSSLLIDGLFCALSILPLSQGSRFCIVLVNVVVASSVQLPLIVSFTLVLFSLRSVASLAVQLPLIIDSFSLVHFVVASLVVQLPLFGS